MISEYLEKFNELRITDFEQELFNHSMTLNNFHIMQCSKYKKFVESHFQIDKMPQSIEDLPFIPLAFKPKKTYIKRPIISHLVIRNEYPTSLWLFHKKISRMTLSSKEEN